MGSNAFKQTRSIDIVLCMDGTGSMSPCIDSVKNNAKRLYKEFSSELQRLGSEIEMLRVKTIVFRDYKSDGRNSMEVSRFFELPSEDDDFDNHLNSIEAEGGCGEDANGLEALYYAMKSDFVTGPKDRQMIAIFADTPAIELLKRKKYSDYPRDMVDERGLIDMWMCVSQSGKLREKNKRLVIFAPQESNYCDLAKKFNRSVFVPVEMHSGLDEISFEAIIKQLAASASGAQ